MLMLLSSFTYFCFLDLNQITIFSIGALFFFFFFTWASYINYQATHPHIFINKTHPFFIFYLSLYCHLFIFYTRIISDKSNFFFFREIHDKVTKLYINHQSTICPPNFSKCEQNSSSFFYLWVKYMTLSTNRAKLLI